jgi:ABC-type uncharacterized transport system fused permease/ATPase subunit
MNIFVRIDIHRTNGQILSLIGSGKTSILRVMGGLWPVSKGLFLSKIQDFSLLSVNK